MESFSREESKARLTLIYAIKNLGGYPMKKVLEIIDAEVESYGSNQNALDDLAHIEMRIKEKLCEENGGHYFLPGGKYSGESEMWCDYCGKHN